MATTEVSIKAIRDSLVQIVKAEPKKYSEAELGRILGVSRARVYELVKRLGLRDLVRPKQWSFHCVDCGRPIAGRGIRRCWQCWLKIWGAKRVALTCDFCGKQFERKESDARRHKFHFCSKSCRGDYARDYGFGAGKARGVKPAVASPKFKMSLPEPSRSGLKLKTRVFELHNEEYSSLVEVAQAMGISNSQIYRVKHGKRPINEKFIIGAIKAFPGHRLSDLFYVIPDGSEQVKDDRERPMDELIREVDRCKHTVSNAVPRGK